MRPAAHGIGDLAIDVVLVACERAQARHPRPGARHRIEHFAVSRPDQASRAARLGVIAVPQGRFATELGDGMLADLVVLSDDPTAVSPGGTGGIEVLATFVGGECRFSVGGISLQR